MLEYSALLLLIVFVISWSVDKALNLPAKFHDIPLSIMAKTGYTREEQMVSWLAHLSGTPVAWDKYPVRARRVQSCGSRHYCETENHANVGPILIWDIKEPLNTTSTLGLAVTILRIIMFRNRLTSSMRLHKIIRSQQARNHF